MDTVEVAFPNKMHCSNVRVAVVTLKSFLQNATTGGKWATYYFLQLRVKLQEFLPKLQHNPDWRGSVGQSIILCPKGLWVPFLIRATPRLGVGP